MVKFEYQGETFVASIEPKHYRDGKLYLDLSEKIGMISFFAYSKTKTLQCTVATANNKTFYFEWLSSKGELSSFVLP